MCKYPFASYQWPPLEGQVTPSDAMMLGEASGFALRSEASWASYRNEIPRGAAGRAYVHRELPAHPAGWKIVETSHHDGFRHRAYQQSTAAS